jgi:hypothetical protein
MPGTTPINGNGIHPHEPIRNHARRYDFALSDYPSRSESLLKRLITTPQNGTSGPKQAEIPLRIIVIGAGLGGLATSIALARRGHKVTVLEQTQKLGEVKASPLTTSHLSLQLSTMVHGKDPLTDSVS